MSRLSLTAPLASATSTVRELQPSDADAVVAQAARGVPIARGRILIPSNSEQASAQIAEFDALREKDQATLLGVFDSQSGELAGVISLRLHEDFVAEGALWNADHHGTRRVTADGLALLTAHAHRHMGIIRLWVEVDPLDQFARYLSAKGGWQLEAKIRPPGGPDKDRYSSVR
ncbi:MAG TPA: GNAT family protein [Actinomycetes bacterium]|nr:GNAT family protein [Actinomycetes bacterium]